MKNLKTKIGLFMGSLVLTASNVFAQGSAGGWSNQNTTYIPDVPGRTKAVTALGNPTNAANTVMDSIRLVINRALGLLAFISLVILLIAGFKMLLNANDDGEQKKAMGVVKNVAIALIFIGAAWLIVSGIFWLIDTITK